MQKPTPASMNSQAVLLAFLVVIAGAGPCRAQAGDAEAPRSHCLFHRADDHFVGSGGRLFDLTPGMTLRPTTAITTGVWREDIRPTSIWAGDMTDQGYPNAPLELEIYAGGSGILRTEYGWFSVTQFISTSTLSFDLEPLTK